MKKLLLNSLIIIFMIFLFINCTKKTEKTDVENNEIIINDIEQIQSEQNQTEIIEEEISYNYNNGNGEILEKINISGKNWIIRKHIVRYNLIGTKTFNNIYDNLGDKGTPSSLTINAGEGFSTLELAISNSETWIKIINDYDVIKWFKTDRSYDPYGKGQWSIIEEFEINDKIITSRMVYDHLHTTETVNVVDIPSLSGNILFQIEKGTLFSYYAMTGETEIIDGEEDHWLYTKDKEGNTGWIFGGYATYDGRGGPKYDRPVDRVWFMLFGDEI